MKNSILVRPKFSFMKLRMQTDHGLKIQSFIFSHENSDTSHSGRHICNILGKLVSNFPLHHPQTKMAAEAQTIPSAFQPTGMAKRTKGAYTLPLRVFLCNSIDHICFHSISLELTYRHTQKQRGMENVISECSTESHLFGY